MGRIICGVSRDMCSTYMKDKMEPFSPQVSSELGMQFQRVRVRMEVYWHKGPISEFLEWIF